MIIDSKNKISSSLKSTELGITISKNQKALMVDDLDLIGI